MGPEETPPPVVMVQMLSGFQLSQALYTVAKLGVADVLLDGPRSIAEIAVAVGADEVSLRRVLRTLASAGVFSEVQPGVFASTPLAETLASATPGSMRDLALMWMETHYAPFGRLLDGVTNGVPAADLYYGQPFFGWLADKPEQIARFSGAMTNLTEGVKLGALAELDLGGVAHLVDLGGATGTVLTALLPRHPGMRATLFDLPHVVVAAPKVLAEAGVGERVEIVGGDFFDAVPVGDCYLFSFVLHDWSDAECQQILANIRSANPAARLAMVEFVSPDGDVPHISKMIDLTMLGMLTGRERSAADWHALFDGAGFELDGFQPTPTPLSIIHAHAR
jgi:O-methyltransferase domain/Dimerisation domain